MARLLPAEVEMDDASGLQPWRIDMVASMAIAWNAGVPTNDSLVLMANILRHGEGG
jgi:hypothetical protein